MEWLPVLALLVGAGSTAAATFRFLGVNDQNWGNGFSWESASAPPADGGDGTSDVLVRGAGGTARLQDFGNNDIDWHIRTLTFESQATGGWTHTGGRLFVGTITNNDTSTDSFSNSQVRLTSVSPTVTAASGNLDFNAQVFLDFSDTIGGVTLNANGGQSVFFDGGVAGSAAFAPNSTLSISGGTLVRLGASSTIFDTVNVTSGTLQLNAASVLDGNVHVTVPSGSTFDLNGFNSDIGQLTGGGDVTLGAGNLTVGDGSNDFTFGGVISGTGGLTKNGSGILTLSGANSYTGTTNITAGTLKLNNSTTDGSLSNSSDVSISSGATFDVNGVTDTVSSISGAGTILLGSGGLLVVNEASGSRTFSGAIQESGTFRKAGGGTLTLSGTNTFSLLDMNAGILQVSSQSNLGSGTIQLSGGELRATATFTNGRSIDANGSGAIGVNTSFTLTQSGVISGTGSVTKLGNGTLILSAANTYTGNTIINGGVLQNSASNRIADGSDVTLIAGATWDLNNFSETVASISGTGGTIDMGGTSSQLTVNAAAGSFTFAGSIINGGTFNKSGAHTLILSGANTVTGTVNINAGILQYSGSGGFTTDADIIVASGATWNLNGVSDSVESISGAGAIQLGAATLTVNDTTGSLTFSGGISGAGGNLVKSGAHTLILSGANSYTGPTTLDAGVLQVASSGNLGTGSLIFDSGTLATTASFTSARAVSINPGNTATFDVATGTTLTHTSTITGNATTQFIKLGGGTFLWSGASGSYAGAVQVQGGTLQIDVNAAQTLTLSGVISGVLGDLAKSNSGMLVLSANNSYGGATSITGGTLRLAGAGSLPDTTDVAISSGATFDLDGVSDTVDSVSGAGAIMLGGATLTVAESGGTRTISGPISEAGSLHKSGSHTLVLSGTNTFVGGVVVDGGILSVSSDGNLGNASNAITLNSATLQAAGSFTATRNVSLVSTGTIDVLTGATLTVQGVVSGAGQLRKTGSGSLVLGGLNTYSGGTNVTGGEVAVGASTGLGAAASVITLAGGNLRATNSFTNNRNIQLGAPGGGISVDTTFTLTQGGAITGSGSLTKLGGGTLLLTTPATHLGDTFINAGTLRFGSGALPDAFNVTVNAPGVWDLNGVSDSIDGLFGNGTVLLGGGVLTLGSANGAGDFSGSIQGAGGIIKMGSGKQILTGVNSYAASTTFNAGVLEVANNGNLGGVSASLIFNGGTLRTTTTFSTGRTTTINTSGTFDVAAGTTLTFTSPIDGAGGLTKIGSGILELTQANTYAGATQINAGTLRLTGAGQLADTTDVDVAAGATFDLTNLNDTIDSLTGGGALLLGTGILTIGSNNGGGTFSGAISGTGSAGTVVKIGTSTAIFSGTNSYAGGTQINGGVLQISQDLNLGAAGGQIRFNSGTLRTTGDISTVREMTIDTAGGSIDVAAGTTLQAGGNIAGIGALTKIGGGTLVLSGISSYSSTNTLGGVLSASFNFNLGAATGPLNIDAGTLRTTNVFTTNRLTTIGAGGATFDVDPSTTLTHNGTIQGNGGAAGLTKTGGGTMLLTGVNTFTAPIHINGGTLQVNLSNQLGDTANPIAFGGGTLSLLGSFANPRLIQLNLGGGTIDVASGVTLAQSAAIQDGSAGPAGNLAKAGTGLLQLSAANTYSSATNINGGTVQLIGAGRLPDTTDVGMAAGTTLDLNNVSDAIDALGGSGDVTLGSGSLTVGSANGGATFDGVISGTGGLVKVGGGTQTLRTRMVGINTFPNTYTGGTVINGGALDVENDGNLGNAAGPLSFDGGTLSISGVGGLSTSRLVTLNAGGGTINATSQTSAATLSGVVSGSGSLTKTGLGALTLAASNTYTGNTVINGGLVSLQGAGRLPDASTVIVNVATGGGPTSQGLQLNDISDTINGLGGNGEVNLGTATFTLGSAGGGGSFGGVIEGTGGIVKIGAGTQIFSGTNTYSGGTTVNGGVLAVGANSHLGNVAGTLTFGGGTLRTTASFVTARATTLSAAGGTIEVNTATILTHNAQISGTGGLTKTGAGTLILSGVNIYGGATTISAGTLRLSVAERLPNTTNVTVNTPGVFDLNNNNETIDGLSGNGSITLGAAQLTVGISGGSGNFSGVISGTGDLQKEGAGTQTLTGTQTFSGATVVNGGQFVLNNGGSISQATLSVGFNNGSNGALTVSGASTTWHLTGNLNVGVSGIGQMNIASGANVTVGGQVAIGLGTGSGTLVVDGGTLNDSAGTQILVAKGLLGGKGTILGNILNQDTVAPGTSPGVLNVTGNYVQDTTGKLVAEVGGTAVGQFDRLAVTSTASLAGSLQLALVGFTPAASDTFAILTSGSLIGSFANVASGARLNITSGGTGSFQVNYGAGSPFGANQVVLSNFIGMATGLVGDYNQNGTVDAADYVVWRKNQGTTNTLPNDSIGGTIGGAQYNQWRAHFGNSGSGAASATAAVPEPSTLVMFVTAMVVMWVRRRGAVS